MATTCISSNAYPTMNAPTMSNETTTTTTNTVSKVTGSAEMDQKMGSNENFQMNVSRSNEMIKTDKKKNKNDGKDTVNPTSIRSNINSLKPPPVQ
uniref:Uncharacterized protein n=1 Tax=Panagrolaimus superbus TaxID=310955 RepID=A0A914YNX7_9BILA